MMEDQDFVGLTIEEAGKLSAKRGIHVRPISIDGKGCMVTCDWRPERLNVKIVEGVVTSTEGRG